jgi:hypothetical protein
VGKWGSMFIEAHPIISLAALTVTLFIFLHIIKATFKLALIVAVVGFILVSVFGFSPNDLLQQGGKMISLSTAYVENTLKPAIYKQLNDRHPGKELSKYLDPNKLEKWLDDLRNKTSDS